LQHGESAGRKRSGGNCVAHPVLLKRRLLDGKRARSSRFVAASQPTPCRQRRQPRRSRSVRRRL
jgi:hypothetical protein